MRDRAPELGRTERLGQHRGCATVGRQRARRISAHQQRLEVWTQLLELVGNGVEVRGLIWRSHMRLFGFHQEDHIQRHWVFDALLFRVSASSPVRGLMGLAMQAIRISVRQGAQAR